MLEINWAGQDWVLRADRSLYWPSRQTLIVADTHFGKAGHFRAAGVPVPSGTTRHTLDRLSVALEATDAKRLLILGDFFHNRNGLTDELLDQLSTWRKRWEGLDIVNVRGNHDRQAGDPPDAWGVRCETGPYHDEVQQTVAMLHEPGVVSNCAVLAGHLHPGVRLQGKGNDSMRVACFWFGSRCAVLPAFGAFTGMSMVRPLKDDRVFAIGPGSVVEIGESVSSRRPTRRAKRSDTTTETFQ